MLARLKPMFWIIPAVISLIILVYLRNQTYSLNRAVREVALRIVQIETISRTTRKDFKITFEEKHYIIESLDRENGIWEHYLTASYYAGIVCQPNSFEFVFSRGRFHEYKYKNDNRKVPKYLIQEFFILDRVKKKGIIFYRNQDWRVIK